MGFNFKKKSEKIEASDQDPNDQLTSVSPDPHTSPLAVSASQNDTPPAFENTTPQSNPNTILYGANTQHPPSTKNRRKPLLIGGMISLLLLASVGFVFGFYLPSRPENVWSTGLDRSGLAIDKLSESLVSENAINAIKNSSISGELTVSQSGEVYTGTFDADYDANKLKAEIRSFLGGGEQEQQIAIDILSETPEGSIYPDSYVKFSGLSALGLDLFVPNIGKYENKWISIKSDYLKGLIPEELEEGKQTQQPSAKDFSDLSGKLIGTTSDYFFTSDTNKAVLELKNVVGEEESSGIQTIHYKATVNKQHAKDYCSQLIRDTLSSEVYKKISAAEQSEIDKNINDTIKSCSESIDKDFKDGEELDVWMDKKYKLLHKVRITDEKDPKNYIEVGQTYSGGDDLKLFMNIVDESSKTTSVVNMDTNIKTFITKTTLSVESGEGESKMSLKASMEAKPGAEDIEINEPKDAVPIQTMLEELGLGDSLGSTTSINELSKDSERQTDIFAIHAQLEAYFAITGHYPGSSNMSFDDLEDKLGGLSPDAFIDPDGTDAQLNNGKATQDTYGYQGKSCNTSNTECAGYSLTALLSDGTYFEKQSLN